MPKSWTPALTGPRATGLVSAYLFHSGAVGSALAAPYPPDLGSDAGSPYGGPTIVAAPSPDDCAVQGYLAGPDDWPIGVGTDITIRMRIIGQASWADGYLAYGAVTLEVTGGVLRISHRGWDPEALVVLTTVAPPGVGEVLELAVTYSATASLATLAVYIDGAPVGSATNGAVTATATWGYWSMQEGSPSFDLALAALWGRLLSSTEIAAEAAAPYETFGGPAGAGLPAADGVGDSVGSADAPAVTQIGPVAAGSGDSVGAADTPSVAQVGPTADGVGGSVGSAGAPAVTQVGPTAAGAADSAGAADAPSVAASGTGAAGAGDSAGTADVPAITQIGPVAAGASDSAGAAGAPIVLVPSAVASGVGDSAGAADAPAIGVVLVVATRLVATMAGQGLNATMSGRGIAASWEAA